MIPILSVIDECQGVEGIKVDVLESGKDIYYMISKKVGSANK